jgi:hypothetical protein
VHHLGGKDAAKLSKVVIRPADVTRNALTPVGSPLFSCGSPVQNDGMTDLLERAVRIARALPPEMQDDVARMMLTFAGEEQHVVQLTPEEEAAIAESEAAEARGDFATEEQVRATWAKHGL